MGKCGCFFSARQLISRGKSHISRVRGLVVRCLLFNPEVSCSNPWVCAYFFTSNPKQKVLTFFGTMRLFGFVRLFSKFFKCPQRVLSSIFRSRKKFSTTYAIVLFFFCFFFSRPFHENFKFLKNCPYDFHEILHSHSTPKGAPACAKASKSYGLDVRNIA